MNDKLILVNSLDEVIGLEEKGKCHEGKGLLHRAFSFFVFNQNGQLLLQQRSKFKKLWPYFWSNSCCSHPRENEDFVDAAQKRLREECGMSCYGVKEVYKFQYSATYLNKGSENEICTVLLGRTFEEPKINPAEVAEIRWVDFYELRKELKTLPEHFTPWFKMEVKALFSDHFYVLKNYLG